MTLKYTVDSYSFTVQGIIRFLVKLVEDFPVAFRDNPPLRLEAVLSCIEKAVSAENITCEVLQQVHQIIHDLEADQSKYLNILEGINRSAGKSTAVQWRSNIFEEFDAYFEERNSKNPKITQRHAARSFYQDKSAKDECFAAHWKNEKTFYRSLCSRNQSPIKNRAREANRQKEAMPYELSHQCIEIMNKWISDDK